MTNPLDLIKRLADALDDDQRGQLDAFQRTALVTEARAFLEGAVEVGADLSRLAREHTEFLEMKAKSDALLRRVDEVLGVQDGEQ